MIQKPKIKQIKMSKRIDENGRTLTTNFENNPKQIVMIEKKILV
jgi:hypothetical protein